MKEEALKNIFLNMAKEEHFPHCMMLQCENSSVQNDFLDFVVKLILCQGKSANKPCLECNSCLKLKYGNHPDLTKITSEGKSRIISVEKVRKIKEDAYIIPTEGDKKIYVFYDAQNMTPQAQNAVLKLFEEPPKNVFFIMLVKNSNNMLPTILSRSQLFYLDSENLQAKNDEDEAFLLAKKIINDIINKKTVDNFLLSSKFSADKALFESVLNKLQSLLDEHLTASVSKNDENNTEPVLSQYSVVYLFDLIDKTQKELNANVNINLLLTNFFIQLTKQ